MSKNYNFQDAKDREQCAKDHWSDIKMMAQKMSMQLGLPFDEMFGVCAQSLVNSMNTFSNEGLIDKIMSAHPEMDPAAAKELAAKKNDFTKFARTMMMWECRAYADTNGRVVRIPANVQRARQKASKNDEDNMVYAGVNDRVSLDSLIEVSRREVDSDGNFDSHDMDNEIANPDIIDNSEDDGERDVENVLDDLIDELKKKYGSEKNAEEEIGIYKDIVTNVLYKDTPIEKKKGDIAKEHGVSASAISFINKKWSDRSRGFFSRKGLI